MNSSIISPQFMSAFRTSFLFHRWIRSKVPTKLPEAPPESACCGQGCANCVWLEYGDQLIEYYSDRNREKALRDLEKKVPDPNIRAFVLSELKMKWKH